MADSDWLDEQKAVYDQWYEDRFKQWEGEPKAKTAGWLAWLAACDYYSRY